MDADAHGAPRRAWRVLVSAGEASGDAHAARLLRGLPPDVRAATQFYGIGGDALRAEGVDTRLGDAKQMAVVGLWEVLARYPFFRRVFKGAVRSLDGERPDAVLTVDYPGFNLRLDAEAHKRGIPVCHYICPQVWAWNRGRIPKIARILDLLMVIFPFETGVFAGTGLKTEFVGHPLVESVKRTLAAPPVALPWDDALPATRVALLPGSREAEVRNILPTMLAAAAELLKRRPATRFLVAAATEADAAKIRRRLDAAPEALRRATDVAVGCMRDVVRTARAAMACSGTATVETALLGCPHIIVYKTSPLTYLIGRLVIRVKWLGMINIIADRTVCPEFIQGDAKPGPMADAVESLLDDGEARTAQTNAFRELAASLATPPERSPGQVFAGFLRGIGEQNPRNLEN